ncbi:hypothetical protein PMZ80_006778 [Knufia obscura]|uniref:Uncharacterized protein n=1 Tax=Knufia obscura TaxID=1635080 RepID=A0ABR0RN20_9EURO|nr:hypothetical protein PMZ80_006778 [Knufia obscura]
MPHKPKYQTRYGCRLCPGRKTFDRLAKRAESAWKSSLEYHVEQQHPEHSSDWEDLKGETTKRIRAWYRKELEEVQRRRSVGGGAQGEAEDADDTNNNARSPAVIEEKSGAGIASRLAEVEMKFTELQGTLRALAVDAQQLEQNRATKGRLSVEKSHRATVAAGVEEETGSRQRKRSRERAREVIENIDEGAEDVQQPPKRRLILNPPRMRLLLRHGASEAAVAGRDS